MKYEIYLSAPSPLAGDFTISVTAQLVGSATAANWGISLYNFNAAVDAFTTSVPLTGGEILQIRCGTGVNIALPAAVGHTTG